ncbi:hypothetical protein SDJN02_00674, partial [Cucurbita argyrosperma subsp. argyrosperma]
MIVTVQKTGNSYRASSEFLYVGQNPVKLNEENSIANSRDPGRSCEKCSHFSSQREIEAEREAD